MTRTFIGAALTAAGLSALLAGCSKPPLPPPNSGASSPAAMVKAIRAADTSSQSVVQVKPLRDPQVDGYLDRARSDEQAGNFSRALDKLNAALKLSPDAPDILQKRAEAEILLDQFPAAEADARRSFALGPKVGGLCASNWQTVLEIAQSKNDQSNIAAARAERNKCNKLAPPHF